MVHEIVRCHSSSNPVFPRRPTSSTRHGQGNNSNWTVDEERLGDLYELHGISHQQAASQGLQDYVRKIIQEEAELMNYSLMGDCRQKQYRKTQGVH